MQYWQYQSSTACYSCEVFICRGEEEPLLNTKQGNKVHEIKQNYCFPLHGCKSWTNIKSFTFSQPTQILSKPMEY